MAEMEAAQEKVGAAARARPCASVHVLTLSTDVGRNDYIDYRSLSDL